MKTYYVYQLRLETSPVPFYIGKGTGKRADAHFTKTSLKRKNMKNGIIANAKKNGIRILVEIIHDCLSEDDAFRLERETIAFYGRRDIGTGILANHTDGGEGTSGIVFTEAHKKKMGESVSKSLKGKSHPPERVKAMKFGVWEKNPAWRLAGQFYDTWVERGRPSVRQTLKMFPEHSIDRMAKKFVSGWNPHEDDAWLDYAASAHRFQ
jgi:hypothetical protein